MIICGIQVIWWSHWIGLGRSGPYPPSSGSIYSQRIRLGLIEVRRFAR